MNYYEVDDLVFAKSKRGFFEPAVVVRPNNQYTRYKVNFIGSKFQKVFPFQELKDYNEENLSIYRNQISIAPDR